MGSMNFGETASPVRVGTDGGIASGMEVAMASLVVASEDNARALTSCLFVEELVGSGQMLSTRIKITAEERS